jgi:hypothetical protein
MAELSPSDQSRISPPGRGNNGNDHRNASASQGNTGGRRPGSRAEGGGRRASNRGPSTGDAVSGTAEE